jgi:predicted  nucleic acid-binding Zn-ribbon protein
MSQPFQLYRLQQLDSQIDQAQARLDKIELALSDNRELMEAESQAEQTSSALEERRKAMQRAENEVKAQRLKIEQTESTLYGGKVRNPKELQDLQNETAALKRYLGTLEDRQLEQMIAYEEAEGEYQLAVERRDQVRAQKSARDQKLSGEQASIIDEIGRLQVERQAATTSIPEADLKLYAQLRQQRRGVAVARVIDTYCSACGSTLSAALLHAARSPNQLTRCDSCGRILYTG